MKEFFKTNEGTADRLLRIVAGIVLLSLTVVGPKTGWGFVGLIIIAVVLVGLFLVFRRYGRR